GVIVDRAERIGGGVDDVAVRIRQALDEHGYGFHVGELHQRFERGAKLLGLVVGGDEFNEDGGHFGATGGFGSLEGAGDEIGILLRLREHLVHQLGPARRFGGGEGG